MSFSKLLKDTGRVDTVETVFDEGVFTMNRIRLKDLNEIKYARRIDTEKIITVFNGQCNVRLEAIDREFVLKEKDICYIPVGEKMVIAKSFGEPLIVIAEGETSFKTPPYIKKFEEIKGILRGDHGFRRIVYTMVGEEDPAGRLIAGFTEGYKGEWTSYPYHKHDDALEAYLYYGMGDYYGIQLVEIGDVTETYIVRNWDVVLIKRGYHPNVAPPKCGINYFWVIYTLVERRLKPEVHQKYL